MRKLASLVLTLFLAVTSCHAQATFPFDATKVRTIDGSDRADNYGKAHEPLARLVAATYPDSTGDTVDTTYNPRSISNMVCSQSSTTLSARYLSAMVWQFGQLLDHDVGLTEGGDAWGTAHVSCTDASDIFVREGCTQVNFSRSEFTGSPREQPNQITAFIDASFVYGSDVDRATRLRQFKNGQLVMSPGTGDGRDLLMFNFRDDPLPNAGGNSSSLFVAGDIRANEQVGLTSMHTLFVREHNRLANAIQAQWPTATDEQVYQLARKIVGAEMQIITYKEWLPALMGTTDAPKLTDHSYSTLIDPRMLTEFTTAIFRFGHSLLQPTLTLGFSKLSSTSIALRTAFFNPALIANQPQNVDLLLGGFLLDRAQELDVFITDEVRNFLFAIDSTTTSCMDLATLNIQRGRDHGLPSYNTLRQAVGLSRKATFAEITTDTYVQSLLSSAYGGDIDKVDAWLGALAEDHRSGSSLGELATIIMQMQFARLRDGDPMFYLSDGDFANSEMFKVFDPNTFSFAKLLRDNTDIPSVPNDVFFIPTPRSCDLGYLDMSLS